MLRKFQISNRLPNRYFPQIVVGCPWIVFMMRTDMDMVYLASRTMMCVLGYCVMKLCLALINAGKRIVQVIEMGTGEQMVVQIAADTMRELRRNSIEIPPIYIPRNAYFKKATFRQFYLELYLIPNPRTYQNGKHVVTVCQL